MKKQDIIKAEQEKELGIQKLFYSESFLPELADLIRSYVDCRTSAFALKVNGEERVFLKTQEEGEQLLKNYTYEFKEEIEVVESKCSKNYVS